MPLVDALLVAAATVAAVLLVTRPDHDETEARRRLAESARRIKAEQADTDQTPERNR